MLIFVLFNVVLLVVNKSMIVLVIKQVFFIGNCISNYNIFSKIVQGLECQLVIFMLINLLLLVFMDSMQVWIIILRMI